VFVSSSRQIACYVDVLIWQPWLLRLSSWFGVGDGNWTSSVEQISTHFISLCAEKQV
jgi:hypothetical protein